MHDHAPRFQGYCPRFESIVRLPESLSLERFRNAVAFQRSGNSMQAISALVSAVFADLATAKLIVCHITSVTGQCHRCRKALLSSH